MFLEVFKILNYEVKNNWKNFEIVINSKKKIRIQNKNLH